MTDFPVCERCGTSSRAVGEDPACPWCHKPMRRGGRAEMAGHVRRLREACFAAAGYLSGVSILDADRLKGWLAEVLKETE